MRKPVNNAGRKTLCKNIVKKNKTIENKTRKRAQPIEWLAKRWKKMFIWRTSADNQLSLHE